MVSDKIKVDNVSIELYCAKRYGQIEDEEPKEFFFEKERKIWSQWKVLTLLAFKKSLERSHSHQITGEYLYNSNWKIDRIYVEKYNLVSVFEILFG